LRNLARMKRIPIAIALALAVSTLNTFAQQPGGGERPPRDGEKVETLTNEQTKQVKVILSKYNPSTITAEQAKAIHAAFQQAGLPGGPAMNEVVADAGFSPDKLRDLDPPPSGQESGACAGSSLWRDGRRDVLLLRDGVCEGEPDFDGGAAQGTAKAA